MNCYPIENDKPIILPSRADYIWEKFEYFDKRAQEYPNVLNYRETMDELLDMWLEQFKKEIKK